ncbi:cupin-like domain-containing protein [Sphingomonas sp. ST-64]|uniref:Cupin-like domain-containing protein n=1 Tax=Sphingomonas plantiphila TaxID=3163295 RepID=A0ABW8YTM4_9SPHN
MTVSPAIVDPAALRDDATFRAEVMRAATPVVMPGAVAKWPLLARPGAHDVIATLRGFDVGREAGLFVGTAETGGRYYYDATLSGFNFTQQAMACGDALQRILDRAGNADGETLYMGSLPSERYFPGAEALTPLPFVPATVCPRFWIGHASSVACHYDIMDNVACVTAGRRRFTLYPPQAIGDLYVGPVDHTMAGQPVALAVDSAPGDPRFPKFEAIRDQALVAELGPGDAIYIPKLWWHKVEALDDINVLANFWWDGFASGPDQPYAAMLLAMIAIAERPAAERDAWRAWFDHYVFRPDGHPLGFLPEERRGILASLGGGNYQRIRTMVMRMLRG